MLSPRVQQDSFKEKLLTDLYFKVKYYGKYSRYFTGKGFQEGY